MHELLRSRINFFLALFFVVTATTIGVVIGIREASKREPTRDYTVVLESETEAPVELQYGIWPALARGDFFSEVRERFVRENASFIEANLTAMTLRVYQSGLPMLEVPIKSKGKEGSWWETPSGLYEAEAKKEKHFSSFGKVYTPWNIPFQGNFFIHGWPYYEDGTPVPEGYSGGCIRLEDVYAKQVYDLAEVGMPILVFEENASSTDVFSYLLKAPPVHAKSYLVADLDTNFVLIAGTTTTAHETTLVPSLMTALVASEYQNIEKRITVGDTTLGGMVPNRLTAGASYSIYDLLFPLLLEGSAEAGQAIASIFPNGRLTELMTAKAYSVGMHDTVFAVAGSAQTNNIATAEDIFALLQYLHTNRPFILDMSAGKADTRAYGAPPFEDLTPAHPLADLEEFDGGAVTGRAPKFASAESVAGAVALAFDAPGVAKGNASEDLVTILTVPFNDTERNIAIIVLDSADPVLDTRALKAYATWLFK
jgi:hypothetical protein